MNIDREEQLEVIVKANDPEQSTENQRMLLHFQRGVIDLENNRFEILNNSEFIERLIDYLYTLHQNDSDGNSIILKKIGFCACDADKELREHAICVLSMFIERISRKINSPEFLETISRILVNWLQVETEYLSGFHSICLQLQTILQKMLGMGLWHQAETMIIVLSQIQKGVIRKNSLIQKTISNIHSSLAEETFLKNLVDVYLDKQEDRRDIAQRLLLHFSSKAAAVLLQTLTDCPDREKRFSLIEFIPVIGKAALPSCDFCLKQNPPWYVIRNLIIIISRLEGPNLYDMVRPYLAHKDIRVQMEVLTCIGRLGGEQMRGRLIEALSCINDDLKQQVVVQLGDMGGKELLSERIQRLDEGDRIVQTTQDTLESLELENNSNTTLDNLSPAQSETLSESEVSKIPVITEGEIDNLLQDILPDTEKELEPIPAPFKVCKEDRSLQSTESSTPPSKEDIPQEAEINLADSSSAMHFTLWSKLYEEMTTEEFTAFHSALKLKIYQPDEMIVEQGDSEAPLFFFDSGTVKLIRIQEGEELHLSTIGAGDLIGSDIFLTGHAWNVSLSAGEDVRAHIFDLEDLLKMQVSFPKLAEKILSFSLKYDVLPTLIRVLDNPDNEDTESARIERGRKSKKPADGILQQATILKKLHGGLCFTSPIKETEKISILLEKQLRLIVRYPSGIIEPLLSTIIGTMRNLARPEELIVFIRFPEPLADLNYSCESLEFLEAA